MRNLPCVLLIALLLLLCLLQPGAASPFPDLPLPAPVTMPGAEPAASGHGLSGGPLMLSSLPESVVILNVYSWFCGPCQAEGPDLRQLNELLHARGLSGAVRLAGIAAGDDTALAARYAEKHSLAYALFPDPDLTLHSLVGSPPVPTFLVVSRDTAGTLRLLMRHTGSIENTAPAFLQRVLEAAGLAAQ